MPIPLTDPAPFLAGASLRSDNPETAGWGRTALRVMWGGIAIFVLIVAVAGIVDFIRGRL